MNDNQRIALAEAVGTAVLVLGGCGSAVFAAPVIGIGGVAAAFGLSLLIMAYTIGPISGCHINPAVTLGMLIAKKIDTAKVPFYIAGQAAGGLGAGFLLWLTFKISDKPIAGGFASNGFGDHSPDSWNLGSVAIVEIVLTALLILVVLGTTHSKFPAGFGGIAAGLTLLVIHLVSIPVSNTSVNPARSLSVAPFAGEGWALAQLWAFIVFPLIGGALGAAIWMGLASDDESLAPQATA